MKNIRFVREPCWFSPNLAFFRAKAFSKLALQKCGFLKEVVLKPKFPNNSIFFRRASFTSVKLAIGLSLVLAVLLIGCSKAERVGAYGGNTSYQRNTSYERTPGLAYDYDESQAVAADGDAAPWEGTGYNPEAPPGPKIANFDSARQRKAAEPGQAGNSGASAENPLKEQKLIKRAELQIEADKSLIDHEGKLSGVTQKVDELMKKYGAYASHTQYREDYAHFTIRVPQVHYESMIAGAGVLGKVKSRFETAEDVTIRYYDLEGQLNTKKTLLTTFQNYLGRARDINDIMKVETRIAELQNEIDWMGNQLTQLANLVDYATVELIVGSYSYTPNTLGNGIGNVFKSFGGFASGALVVLLAVVVYGIPVIVICLLAFWLLFGRVGILKKAFRFALGGKNTEPRRSNTTAAKNDKNHTGEP